jgi:hypothetical protein
MNNCKTYIATPLLEDLCNGEVKDVKCVIDENAYVDLGIEADSNQGDINQAVYNALQASKTTTDELQAQIDDIVGSIVTNATTTELSASTLTSTYPTATKGFKVHALDIVAGGRIYEKTATGWCEYLATKKT